MNFNNVGLSSCVRGRKCTSDSQKNGQTSFSRAEYYFQVQNKHFIAQKMARLLFLGLCSCVRGIQGRD